VRSRSGAFAALNLLIAATLLALAGNAPAAATAYEPLNYSAGALATGTAATGDGFTGNWTCGAAGTIVSGLTYSGLPAAHNALSSGGSRQFVSLANPLATGTKWISFLFATNPGNPGANKNGVYFPNGGTGLWFGFGLNPLSGTQGQLGLGSMNTLGTAALGATSLLQLGLGTYGNTYLVALEIQFNTSGNNDTITVYLNPVANQATPGVTAAGTISSFDVGTISGVGLNVQGAGSILLDEFRVGDTYSDVVGFINIPPNAPTGLTATPGANSVVLSWTAATGNPISYNVKRSLELDGTYTTIGTTTAPTVSYNDSILGGQTFYYAVSAVNAAGESTNSSPASAAPTLAAPAAPTGLAGTAGDAQVALSWTATPFATSYNVKRATDVAGPYSPVGSTTAPTVTYTDASGLANGTTYYYVVSATGTGGTGGDSSPVSVTPVAPIPLLVSITRGAGVSWLASNGVTYQVQWSSVLLGTNTVWNNLGNSIAGNGTTNTVFDPVGPPHNFYQILSIQ
jgi:fibronectin type 3 domain-containing protein